jgi:hypothetical protein
MIPVCEDQSVEARLVIIKLGLTVAKPVSSNGNGYVK